MTHLPRHFLEQGRQVARAQGPLRGELGEGALDHVFNGQVLRPEEVEDHVVGQAELGLQPACLVLVLGF